MKRSVLLKLTLLIVAILAILLGALLTAGNRFWREVLREQIDAHLSSVAQGRRHFVRQWIDHQQERVELVARRGILRNYLERHAKGQSAETQRAESQENLEGYVRAKAAVAAHLISREGRVLVSTDAAEVGRDLSGDPTFLGGLERPVVGLPRLVEGRALVEVAAPCRWLDGRDGFIGVAVLTLDATPLALALRDTTGLGKTGEVLLGVRDRGQIRFIFPSRLREDIVSVPEADTPALAAAVEGDELLTHNRDYRGEPVLTAGFPVGAGGWGLVAKMDEAEAYAPIAQAWRLMLLLGGIVGLAGLAAAFVLARRFTRPIRRLAAATARVASRDYETTVPVNGSDELSLLAANFNEMTAAIRARGAERDAHEAALRESEERLRTIGDNLPGGAIYRYGVRPDGSQFFTHMSAGIERSAGFPVGELLAQPQKVFENILPEDAVRMERATRESAAALSPFDHQFRRQLLATGAVHWFHSRSMPRRREDGTVLWDGVEFDITKLKQAEEKLRLLNQELESRVIARTAELQTAVAARESEITERRQAEERVLHLNSQLSKRVEELAAVNAELEAFSYTVSHDLRAPLRHVSGYIQLLAKGAGDALDPKTADYIPRIQSAAGRMGELIDALLAFARLNRASLQRSAVDLGPVITEIRATLQPALEGRSVDWKIGALPTVQGDPAMLRQVLANLLENAIKFTRNTAAAVIEVTCESDASEHVFRVRDNGAGFDSRYAGKLFGVFQRLHSESEFEGTGIGLATVRRIIERHGGRTWAESQPGEGADFYFTLPKNSSAC